MSTPHIVSEPTLTDFSVAPHAAQLASLFFIAEEGVQGPEPDFFEALEEAYPDGCGLLQLMSWAADNHPIHAALVCTHATAPEDERILNVVRDYHRLHERFIEWLDNPPKG
jgi:hypothetical protein